MMNIFETSSSAATATDLIHLTRVFMKFRDTTKEALLQQGSETALTQGSMIYSVNSSLLPSNTSSIRNPGAGAR